MNGNTGRENCWIVDMLQVAQALARPAISTEAARFAPAKAGATGKSAND
jgi:hypothetical protein